MPELDPPIAPPRARLPILAPVVLAALLAGCAEGGDTIGGTGIIAPSRNALSNHSWRYTCERYDPTTGALTEKILVEDNTQPNDHAVDVVGSIATSVVGKFPSPVPVPLGARQGAAPPPPLTVAACLGTHFQGDRGEPPNPVPSGWRQSSSADNPFAPPAYGPPRLDAFGVARAGDDVLAEDTP